MVDFPRHFVEIQHDLNKMHKPFLELAAKGFLPHKINKITNFAMHTVRQINQIDQRLLKGETISLNEKVFSIFEPNTRWISKGKAGRPVELGVPVGIAEDQYQFILHHEGSVRELCAQISGNIISGANQ